MIEDRVVIDDISLRVYTLNTVVVGSGAAGLNAAIQLYTRGQRDTAIVTEGLHMGTSRNTGSDKQTYYKLTLAGNTPDSVYEMAQTLFNGGAMDGDIALAEAALSSQCFYHLAGIGVPFPHNRFGEYIGYKTDHDPRQRAASAGPLTSRIMTERLEEQVLQRGILIFDGYQVIGILTDPERENAVGLLALDIHRLEEKEDRYVLFNCTNIVYAVGGPAGLYEASVYPESQTGASGIALEAGVQGKNLTESQYGIASIRFRWNLSGTYQQVLPRYISTTQQGRDEQEFLLPYFESPGQMLDAVFLKGYQWPFDPRKVLNGGSSLIDILVYRETVLRGRRVFLDYTRNPAVSDGSALDFNTLGSEAYEYLENSRALFGTPIERLMHMNQPAVDLYRNQGIDLHHEYLEIAVCAQHNNGGLTGNIWWESNLGHFFPVGEVNGSHGVYRPGGSALNAGQAGSTRAAQYIAANYPSDPLPIEDFMAMTTKTVSRKIALGERLLRGVSSSGNVIEQRKEIGRRTSQAGAHIRSREITQRALLEAKQALSVFEDNTRLASFRELPMAFQNLDLLITQVVYLSAIQNYIEKGGQSRGSYLIADPRGDLPADGLEDCFRFTLTQTNCLSGEIQQTLYEKGGCIFDWRPVRPIPEDDDWFENIWNAYRKGEVIR